MKIKSFEFAYIKAFKSLKFDFGKTSVLIGQNDHGKSSILKALDIVLNQLDEQTLQLGALHPDLAEKLVPIFPVNAKARRITINYEEKGVEKQLYVALQRLEQKAAENPDIQFILAVEEPEAFLHPQKQKELYQNICSAQSANLRIIVTTHSPYIVSETPFTKLGLVKKHDQHSALHVPEIKNQNEAEMFDAYSNEVNSQLFFADKIILVEGESDYRVIRLLLDRKLGTQAHRISVISASGNKNFSPFLRMIRAWTAAKIPHLVVTDFDSLTKSTDRAIITGAKDAGYTLSGEAALHGKIDAALDKGEAEFAAVSKEAGTALSAAGLNVFIFTSDLEHSLITPANKDAAAAVLSTANPGTDYGTGFDLAALKRMIGSKGVPLNPAADPKFKKPFIHSKIARSIDLKSCHADLTRLLTAIENL